MPHSGTPPGGGYSLSLGLYRLSTYESLGSWSLPVELGEATLWPEAPIVADLGGGVALSSLEAPGTVQQGDSLALIAYWSAVDVPSAAYSALWRLQGDEAEFEFDLPLAAGSDPTAWPAGAYVAGRAALAIPSLAPPGQYELSVTLVDVEGRAAGTYDHAEPVLVGERERSWELPEMDQRVGARFGGMIELAGYDLTLDDRSALLTLHWRALANPDRDYTFFVHLADPGTGVPATQIDSMPRGYAYPTSLWLSGEVVSDQVALSLLEAPSGSYDLAVGWYWADTMVRLPATDSSGRPLGGDRVVLPQGVSVP